MKKLKTIWKWLVLSSANANNISLTVKGILTAILPVLILILQTFNLETDSQTLADVINYTGTIIVSLGGAIASVATAVGLFRKIKLTLTGNNNVLNTQEL